MNKHVFRVIGLAAACVAMLPLAAIAGDATDAQVYTFQVEVDGKGVLTYVAPVDGAGDATTAQLQRELSGWLFERSGAARAGDKITTWVRLKAIPANEGVAAQILSATAGPSPDVLTRPAYPANARRLGHEGVVVLELAMDANGAIRDASVHETFGQIDRAMANAALAAARNWSFRTERVNGASQSGKVLMPVCFTVSEVQACEWTGPNHQALGRDTVLALAPAVRLVNPSSYAVK